MGSAKQLFLAYALSGLILALVFLPAIVIPYAHHDNARYFSKPADRTITSCSEDKHYREGKRLGRLVAAEIECRINFKHTRSLADLSVLKALAAAIVIVSGWLLIRFFAHGGLTLGASGILAILLLVLPGVQYVVMIANLAISLTLMVTVAAANVHFARRSGWLTDLLTVSLLFFGFQCYPPWVFAFPILVCFRCFVGRDSLHEAPASGVAKCVKGIALFAIAAAVSIPIRNAVIRNALLGGPPLAGRYTADISPAIIGRILDDGLSAVSAASQLWYSYLPSVPYILIALLIAIWSYLVLNRKTGRTALLGMVYALNGVAFGILPWAIPKDPIILTRVVFPLSIALVLAAATGILLICRMSAEQSGSSLASTPRRGIRFAGWMAHGVVGAVVITAPLAAMLSATSSAWASGTELQYLIQQLAGHDLSKVKRVHVVRPTVEHHGYNRLPAIGDEFNRKTSYYFFDVADLVNVGLRELGSNRITRDCWRHRDAEHGKCLASFPQHGEILVTQGRRTDPICSGDNVVVVDFSALDHAVERSDRPYAGPQLIECP